MMKSLLVLATISTVALGFQNTPPVPERHPGYSEGKGRQMIDIEIFYDLICDGSAAFHPEFLGFLNMPFLTGTVRDAVRVNYNFMPLPYHYGSWIPHKILPYIIDQCIKDTMSCKFPYYVQWTFDNRAKLLTAQDKSYNQLVDMWTGMVSSAFGWNQVDLKDLFDYETDKNDSEMRTRLMWKSSTHVGVAATPSAAVNGIQLQEPPFTADEWMKLLNDVYNAQKQHARSYPVYPTNESFLRY